MKLRHDPKDEQKYIGITEGPLKQRIFTYRTTFTYINYTNSTTPSNHIVTYKAKK